MKRLIYHMIIFSLLMSGCAHFLPESDSSQYLLNYNSVSNELQVIKKLSIKHNKSSEYDGRDFDVFVDIDIEGKLVDKNKNPIKYKSIDYDILFDKQSIKPYGVRFSVSTDETGVFKENIKKDETCYLPKSFYDKEKLISIVFYDDAYKYEIEILKKEFAKGKVVKVVNPIQIEYIFNLDKNEIVARRDIYLEEKKAKDLESSDVLIGNEYEVPFQNNEIIIEENEYYSENNDKAEKEQREKTLKLQEKIKDKVCDRNFKPSNKIARRVKNMDSNKNIEIRGKLAYDYVRAMEQNKIGLIPANVAVDLQFNPRLYKQVTGVQYDDFESLLYAYYFVNQSEAIKFAKSIRDTLSEYIHIKSWVGSSSSITLYYYVVKDNNWYLIGRDDSLWAH